MPVEDSDLDYITLMACINPNKAIVSHMRFDPVDDGYKVLRCSDALSIRGAYALAHKWADEKKLEVR